MSPQTKNVVIEALKEHRARWMSNWRAFEGDTSVYMADARIEAARARVAEIEAALLEVADS